MTYLKKPKFAHPSLKTNALGLTARDYEGTVSTMCAGCGHDSITAALIQAFHELDIQPHRVAKMSGIGCSSKTPAYFMSDAHAFNSVHGRMPAVATGAYAANPTLKFVGVSGDGDSLSIGLGQMCHALRRNLNLLYVIENNGVYGLTKGQFSASADVGSKSKAGIENRQGPIDPVKIALAAGATFVARSFSGDKQQLIPILKAAMAHKGTALVDVISPCVTFNNHAGSTKSYEATRQRHEVLSKVDYVPPQTEIRTKYPAGGDTDVALHDGSVLHLSKVPDSFDVHDRAHVFSTIEDYASRHRVLTGVLYIDPEAPEMHEAANTSDAPMSEIPFAQLCPGSAKLEALQNSLR